jgi:hypothetical protein
VTKLSEAAVLIRRFGHFAVQQTRKKSDFAGQYLVARDLHIRAASSNKLPEVQ